MLGPLAHLRRLEPRLRAAALFPLAALLVHQLRYWVASGDSTGRVLAEQGHSYLGVVTAPLVLLLAAAAGAFVARLAVRESIATAGHPSGRGPLCARPAWVTWLAVALALVAVYAGQELMEGLLASGHPGGLAGVFGGGGWFAGPAALAVGAAVTAVMRLAERVAEARSAAPRRVPAAARPVRHLARVDRPRTAPLALRAAGRAPPARVSVHP